MSMLKEKLAMAEPPTKSQRLKELEKDSKLSIMEQVIWLEEALRGALREKQEVLHEYQKLQGELQAVRAEPRREKNIVDAITRMANR